MLAHISKAELAEMAKKMRAVANMPKDSLLKKRKLQSPLLKLWLSRKRKPPRGLFLKEKGKQLLPLPSILTRMVEPPSRRCSLRRTNSAPRCNCHSRR